MKLKDDVGGKPMMADKEIEIIDNLLNELKPKRCLEWGSGNSTVYFPKNHPDIEEWLSIEHLSMYPELLNSKLREGVSIILVQDNQDYENFPETLEDKRPFDFILVDGQRRDECVDKAFEYLREGGVMLLHDSGREESANILKKYKGKYEILIEGEQMLKTGFYAHRGIAKFIK